MFIKLGEISENNGIDYEQAPQYIIEKINNQIKYVQTFITNVSSQFYLFSKSDMSNVIIQRVKKIVPVLYIMLQGIILLVVHILEAGNTLFYLFVSMASLTYLWTAMSDPGYVAYDEVKESPPLPFKSEPVIPLSPSQIEQALGGELQFQLGVESNLKDDSSNDKQEKIVAPQQRQGEKEEQKQKKPQKNVMKDWKIQKFEQLKQKKDKIMEQNPIKPIVLDEMTGFMIVPIQLQQVSRWCSSCKNNQKLRVRHCNECKRCVSTFDHHCPWMNNCIGQKNKLPLILFAVAQTAQLLHLAAYILDILHQSVYNRSLMLLWLMVVLLAITVGSMLIFQLFMISRNITTWEHARWSKIQYLTIFDKEKLKSLFDKGIMANFKVFLKSSWSKQPTNWLAFISPNAHKYLINKQSSTDRRLIAK